MSGHVNVTTPSRKKRHFARPGVGYTLCFNSAVRPDRSRRRNCLTQHQIDVLPLCKQCERIAGLIGATR
jgi:hypothetical protein